MTAEIIKTMKETVSLFLEQRNRKAHPILVGFSGGGDSLALVHLFLELECEIVLAHFDHGWRSESQIQCQHLAEYAEKIGVEFYTERSEVPDKTENGSRIQRWNFFKKIFNKGCFEALALAHHSEDQAETVLKRTLEGAHFYNFAGIRPFVEREGIPIWRPLLSHSKKELASVQDYLKMEPIDDPTNRDSRYLRARMRKDLMPKLNTMFGKNVVAPLARLSEKGGQLDDYLKNQTKKRVFQRDKRGLFIDLSGAHPVEIDYLLSKASLPTPSYHTLKIIHRAVEKKEKKVWASHTILVDEGVVVWTK